MTRIEARQKGARSMGDFVGWTPDSTYVATERHCAACGCRLRTSNPTTYCAPCSDRIHPWTPPEPRTPPDELERRRQAWHTNASNQCPSCGAYKSQGARTCAPCFLQRVKNTDPWHGPVCACGGHKAIDAKMCKHCRYPSTRTP